MLRHSTDALAALVAAVALGVALLPTGAAAQPDHFVNAQVRTTPAGASLERDIDLLVAASVSPAWIGYSVPAVPGDRDMCCWDGALAATASSGGGGAGGCRLEDARTGSGGSPPRPVRLEGPSALVVMIRADQRRIVRLRVFSDNCVLDAGGLVVHWIDGVRAASSVAWLKARALDAALRPSTSRDASPFRGAIVGLALHEDRSATAALEDLADASRPLSLRKQAAFWLGSTRGAEGFALLARWLARDPDAAFRRELTFAVSVSREEGATGMLVRAAHDDTSASVRSQALFWLAERAGTAAAAAIQGAIESDPDTEVKKRAVFALSRLPKDEGVPLLIELARTHKNPEVRKQACFWLGQSNDPRALRYFEEILTR